MIGQVDGDPISKKDQNDNHSVKTEEKELTSREEKARFKKFLETQPGYEHHYPQLWKELSKFAMGALRESTSKDNSEQLLQNIAELHPVISDLKKD